MGESAAFDPEISQLLASLSGNDLADRDALMALAGFARADSRILRVVVERFPRAVHRASDRRAAIQPVRTEMARRLSDCVLELTAIVEELPAVISSTGSGIEEAKRLAEYATEILGEIGEPAGAAVPAIIRAMHANPRGVGEFAGMALGRIGGEEAVRELNRIWFSSLDRKLGDSCTQGLELLGDRAHATLLKILDEPDEVDRARALLSLRASGYPRNALCAIALRRIDSDPSTAVQETSIRLLKDCDDPEQLQAVLTALRQICNDEYGHFARTRNLAAETIQSLLSVDG